MRFFINYSLLKQFHRKISIQIIDKIPHYKAQNAQNTTPKRKENNKNNKDSKI